MHRNSEAPAARRRALFIDRDATIICDARYLDHPAGVELLPGVRQALRRARRDYRLFLFSNQSGISRGYFTWEQVDAVNARLYELLGMGRDLFDAVCMAGDSPDSSLFYRKPSPRFILECMDQFALDPDACWMAGDRLSDLQAGVRAGIRAALITSGKKTDAPLADYLRLHAIPAYDTLAAFIGTLPDVSR